MIMTERMDISSALSSVSDFDALLDLFPPALRSHSRRVAICSAAIAEHAQSFNYQDGLPIIAHLSGTFHDVGKLLLPPLISDETEYQMHPAIGAELMYQYRHVLFDNEVHAQMVCEAARFHHERPDGKGFPYGRPYIPLTAGICAIADELDHRLFINGEEDMSAVYQDLTDQTGGRFWGSIVNCFERAWPQLREFYTKWI